ncbi:MAG: hypothetical protein G01um10148_620 [Parcubacteria group bacterium Gr01-1014_8]|nr:MAG: hypothetical protein G01um10148_620 [Parcubacteria group bacterium Gr01-1014_8]
MKATSKRPNKPKTRRYSEGIWIPVQKTWYGVSKRAAKGEATLREVSEVEAKRLNRSMPSLSASASILFVLWFLGFVGVYSAGPFLPIMLFASMLLAVVRIGQEYGYVGKNTVDAREQIRGLVVFIAHIDLVPHSIDFYLKSRLIRFLTAPFRNKRLLAK